MSLEAFAYSTKGIAHELGRPHEEVLAALEAAEPRLNSNTVEPMSVSARTLLDLKDRASGEDEYILLRQQTSPLFSPGLVASYANPLTRRDAQEAAHSLACMRPSPRAAPDDAALLPEWTANTRPDLQTRIARRLVWQHGQPPPTRRASAWNL
jgi:hypothetical protein